MEGVKKDVYEEKWKMEEEEKGKTGCFSKFLDRRWISLAILVFVNLINYADRYSLSAVLGDAQNELCGDRRCDTFEMGFIPTAFIIFYFAGAPLFGYLGDRYSRKILMAAGIAIWAGFSLATSFMPNYWSFLIVRAMYALGESAFTTIAPCVLGDLFTDETRSLVYGLFYMAIPIGSGLGFVLGGAPSEWRWGLRITPGLTFLSAILVLFFLYDPPRGESEGKEEAALERTSWLQDLKYIFSVKSFVLNAVGFTCVTFTTGALAYFAPVYFETGIDSLAKGCPGYDPNYETFDKDSVNFVIGAITAGAGLGGVLAGMLLSCYLRPKFEWIDPFICGASLLISIPLLVVAVQLARDNILGGFVAMFFGMFFLNTNWSVAVDMTIYVITPTRRASAEAVHLMMTHALGEAGATSLVGALVDAIKPQMTERYPEAVESCPKLIEYYQYQNGIYLPMALLALGGILFLVACRYVVRDKQAVEKETRSL